MFGSSSSSSGGGAGSSGPRSHDIKTQSGLTNLYNQKVVHAESYTRPLAGSGSSASMGIQMPAVGPFSTSGNYGTNHSGTVVTTQNNSKYLIHKGGNYGGSGGNTVAVDASHMGSSWKPIPGSSHSVSNSKVGDYVSAGGTGYNVRKDNCHMARHRMNKLD